MTTNRGNNTVLVRGGLAVALLVLIVSLVFFRAGSESSTGAQGAATATTFSTPVSTADVATMEIPEGTPMTKNTPPP